MASRLPKNIHEAFRDVVRQYGVEELAGLLGTSPGVLYNKINLEGDSYNKPTLADAIITTTITRDTRIAECFCLLAGGIFVPSPDLSDLTTDSLLQHLLKIEAEGGDFYHEIQKLIGGKAPLTTATYTHIEKEASEWIAAIHEALIRIQEMTQ